MAERDLRCIQCNRRMHGRPDKKFCSESCKNEFHNARRMDVNTDTKTIRLTLNRNRNVLRKILGEEKVVTVTKDQLVRAGYHFDYHTHHFKNWKEEEYIFCFDFGYREMAGGKYKVVKSLKKE